MQNPHTIIFKREFTQIAQDYLNEQNPTLEGLATLLAVTKDTLMQWASKRKKDEQGNITEELARPHFHQAITRLQEIEKNGKPKHAGGRPPLYTSAEELQKIIDEYFDYCDNKTKEIHSDKLGDMIVPDPEPYTMSGLAYRLGIDRKTLINYGERDGFFHTIKKARARVEADIERRMNGKDTFTPGLIFNAKNNFGWQETQNIDHTTKGKELPTPIMGGTTANVQSNDSNAQTP